jgi:ABC-type proline/glycine betaine transport system permease subunit
MPICLWQIGWKNMLKEWLFNQRPLFKKLSAPIDTVLSSLDNLFNFVPFPIVVLLIAFAAYKTNGIGLQFLQ